MTKTEKTIKLKQGQKIIGVYRGGVTLHQVRRFHVRSIRLVGSAQVFDKLSYVPKGSVVVITRKRDKLITRESTNGRKYKLRAPRYVVEYFAE